LTTRYSSPYPTPSIDRNGLLVISAIPTGGGDAIAQHRNGSEISGLSVVPADGVANLRPMRYPDRFIRADPINLIHGPSDPAPNKRSNQNTCSSR
jgi:hypothetical protein